MGDGNPPCRVERYSAPIFVLLFHAALVGDVIIHQPSLQTASSWETCIAWASTAAAVISYMSAALVDPGYLRPDGFSTKVKQNPVAIGRQIFDRIRRDKTSYNGLCDADDIEMASLDGTKNGIQQRFCDKCKMDQPLRTKHCHDCGWCIRTHDHHCPWLGNCVGENNRASFLWFLTFQFIELGIYFVQAILTIAGSRSRSQLGFPSVFLICGTVTIFSMLMIVCCLLFFHCFLAIANLTTWENVSWQRITYLKTLKEEKGSPFSRSLRDNLLVFCCSPGASREFRPEANGYTKWELGPPHVPKLLHYIQCRCCD
eukprot:GEMP01031964.1.p1 GENE.GEMP01031964.1~~GEMP01031964.1.p1  ORF type:complete len:314 (+),score=49.96 GEMP01031964.1:31-972(+)